ncbi:hypothetical protein BGZ95_004929 [Linnemannia exigua]|uniref:Uncharacterized protein n=1 Tax=Linnemannia exigua TaxID=604196 RepID=A0AAD4D4J2_9FUNG|nr:hypothetical protein BGZ95_004929 [Linnemannia exigua]
MLAKVAILTDRAAVPEGDDGVLKIEGEESFNVNPFYTFETDVGKIIERFAISDRWQPAQDDNDPRFYAFSEPPGTPRPIWLQDFLAYARKRRYEYKKAVGEGKWMMAQMRCLRTLVLRFFNNSDAEQSPQALLRASVVLGCFFLCYQGSLGAMTNMVHHLSASCPPIASARTSRTISELSSEDAAALLHSNRLDRTATKGDLKIVVRNQQTLMAALNSIRKAVQYKQNEEMTKSRNKSNWSDEEGDERYQIELLSDDEEGSTGNLINDMPRSPSAGRIKNEAYSDDDSEIGEYSQSIKKQKTT